MKIDLTIFNSILYGDLRPWIEENKSDEKFKQKLFPVIELEKGNADLFIEKLEKAFAEHPLIKENVDYTLEIDDHKIAIRETESSIFEPLIDLDIPPHFNYKTEFYEYLITNEGTRLMNNLDKALQLCEEEADAKYLVNGTLTKIKTLLRETSRLLRQISYSDNLAYDQLPDDPIEADKKINDFILGVLKVTLIRLILEIQSLYTNFLSAKPLSEDEIYVQVMGVAAPSVQLARFSPKLNETIVKKYVEVIEYAVEKTRDRLDETKSIIQRHFNSKALSKEFAAKKSTLLDHVFILENLHYIREFGFAETNPSYEQLLSVQYADEIFEKATTAIYDTLDQFDRADKRLLAISREEEKLGFLKTYIQLDEAIYKPSIPRRILKWLEDYRSFVSANLSIDFGKLKTADLPKIPTTLAVPELAYLFRKLVDEDVLTPKQKTDLFKVIAAIFTTKKSDDLSAASIKNKFDTPDYNAIDFWQGKFTHLMQAAKKDKEK